LFKPLIIYTQSDYNGSQGYEKHLSFIHPFQLRIEANPVDRKFNAL